MPARAPGRDGPQRARRPAQLARDGLAVLVGDRFELHWTYLLPTTEFHRFSNHGWAGPGACGGCWLDWAPTSPGSCTMYGVSPGMTYRSRRRASAITWAGSDSCALRCSNC